MENNKHSGQWIDEVMNSLNGVQRIPANPLLYDKVMAAINTRKQGNNIKILLPRIAAVAVLLLVINAFSIVHYTKKVNQPTGQNLYQVVNEEFTSLAADDGY